MCNSTSPHRCWTSLYCVQSDIFTLYRRTRQCRLNCTVLYCSALHFFTSLQCSRCEVPSANFYAHLFSPQGGVQTVLCCSRLTLLHIVHVIFSSRYVQPRTCILLVIAAVRCGSTDSTVLSNTVYFTLSTTLTLLASFSLEQLCATVVCQLILASHRMRKHRQCCIVSAEYCVSMQVFDGPADDEERHEHSQGWRASLVSPRLEMKNTRERYKSISA